MDIKKYEVPVEKLRWECDPRQFDFKCTSELAPLREFIGQERATRAEMAEKLKGFYAEEKKEDK